MGALKKVFSEDKLATGLAVLVILIGYGFARRAVPMLPPAGQ